MGENEEEPLGNLVGLGAGQWVWGRESLPLGVLHLQGQDV